MSWAAAWLTLALATAQPPATRHFSDVCREPQSDDFAGRYVTLGRSGPAAGGSGWAVGYSATEGALDAPAPASDVRYDPRSGRLSFEVETWERIRFRGRVAAHALVGEMRHDAGAPRRIRLPEVAAQAPYPACR